MAESGGAILPNRRGWLGALSDHFWGRPGLLIFLMLLPAVLWLGIAKWASLRPEAVHVIKAGGGASAMTGTVTSRSYMGSTTRLAIDLGKHRIHAVLPSTGDVPAEGDRVTVGFSKDALHLMESPE